MSFQAVNEELGSRRHHCPLGRQGLQAMGMGGRGARELPGPPPFHQGLQALTRVHVMLRSSVTVPEAVGWPETQVLKTG